MAAIRAAHAGDAVIEDAAVEVAMDGRLNASTQVPVRLLEALLIDELEALESRAYYSRSATPWLAYAPGKTRSENSSPATSIRAAQTLYSPVPVTASPASVVR